MENMDTVRIFDTTLRDGEQSPGATLTRPEKLEIAKLLESMGVDIIEAGFPISSNGDFEAVHAIASEIGKSVVCGLARCTPGGHRPGRRSGATRASINAFTFFAPRAKSIASTSSRREKSRSSRSASNRSGRRSSTRMMLSFPPKTPAGQNWIFWKRSSTPPWRPARPR